ncbi:Hypothetical protein, putative [Bodo saltans]|uniref:Uncharacterized protein n=1 Tax=Bodo saltans TaxID=75058 RepID=A0A0S4ITK4_BODSA|nr:Hypothetical protein, putative [Bodo saltans]|eukprot:CUG06667.1 Hypothetical protein, putative [Bodo saltans]
MHTARARLLFASAFSMQCHLTQPFLSRPSSPPRLFLLFVCSLCTAPIVSLFSTKYTMCAEETHATTLSIHSDPISPLHCASLSLSILCCAHTFLSHTYTPAPSLSLSLSHIHSSSHFSITHTTTKLCHDPFTTGKKGCSLFVLSLSMTISIKTAQCDVDSHLFSCIAAFITISIKQLLGTSDRS